MKFMVTIGTMDKECGTCGNVAKNDTAEMIDWPAAISDAVETYLADFDNFDAGSVLVEAY